MNWRQLSVETPCALAGYRFSDPFNHHFSSGQNVCVSRFVRRLEMFVINTGQGGFELGVNESQEFRSIAGPRSNSARSRFALKFLESRDGFPATRPQQIPGFVPRDRTRDIAP